MSPASPERLSLDPTDPSATCASAALKAEVHRRLLGDAFLGTAGDRIELSDQIAELVTQTSPVLGDAERRELIDELVRDVDGLGPLEPLLADDTITEIMLNGPHRAFVERCGALEPIDLGLDAGALARIAERVVAPLGLRLDRSSPMVDASLADGSRFHAVLPPLAPDGPCLTIRRFSTRPLPLPAFGLDDAAVAAIREWLREGRNVLVAGGTSAGKTTLLDAMSECLDPVERIVTIEETAELRLRHENVVRLEARPANAEGVGAVSMRDLVRAALRMRPDRIVVGEVRGGEAFDLLCALNTGHDGSLATVHANSASDALGRIETLALLADTGLPMSVLRAQVAAAVDLVVFVRRGVRGLRRIEEVGEVIPDASGDAPRVRAVLERVGGRPVVASMLDRPSRRTIESAERS